ncbi:hypothetical protein MLD38_040179 [Melastoma candidum]|uniref:Uncharacterized protein n=1 Tax=Melastoma candidum TaxID=119954 RepID=A0ACB9L4F5_9MYRT|nr:hypothetical protein MLD38_040179 [Melastoma candidum]
MGVGVSIEEVARLVEGSEGADQLSTLLAKAYPFPAKALLALTLVLSLLHKFELPLVEDELYEFLDGTLCFLRNQTVRRTCYRLLLQEEPF